MKTPRIRGRFDAVQLDGETVWVSADGAWVVVPRPHLERYVGHEVSRAHHDGLETDFGLVLGTGGGEKPATMALELRPQTSLRPATMEVIELESFEELEEEVPRDPAREERLRILALLALASALCVLGAAVSAALFLRATTPVPEEPAAASGLQDIAPRAVLMAPAPASRPVVEPPPWQHDLDRGQALIASDPYQAMEHFRRALVMQPRHAGALAGLGAAELALGAGADGVEHLCEARRLDRSVSAQVDAVLHANGATCDVGTP